MYIYICTYICIHIIFHTIYIYWCTWIYDEYIFVYVHVWAIIYYTLWYIYVHRYMIHNISMYIYIYIYDIQKPSSPNEGSDREHHITDAVNSLIFQLFPRQWIYMYTHIYDVIYTIWDNIYIYIYIYRYAWCIVYYTIQHIRQPLIHMRGQFASIHTFVESFHLFPERVYIYIYIYIYIYMICNILHDIIYTYIDIWCIIHYKNQCIQIKV